MINTVNIYALVRLMKSVITGLTAKSFQS